MLDRVLAPQVAIEGAQARHLARERGRRSRRRRKRQLGQKRGKVAVAGLDGAQAAAVQELAEREQVRAVGVERVARQPPLELEIGEKVEEEMLER